MSYSRADKERRQGERRADFCALHDVKCQEIKRAHTGIKTRLPIWVFCFVITGIFSVIGWLNYDITKRSEVTQAALSQHIEVSNRLQKRLIHVVNAVAWNQRRVMGHLKLEFQDVPDIESP